jgi:hypothetical protein
MTPDESLEFLRQAHHAPLPDAHLATVRARVLAEIARPRPARRPWVWNLAALCAAAALIWILLVRPERRPPLRHVPAPQLAAAAPPVVARSRPVASRPHHARRHFSTAAVHRAGLKPGPPSVSRATPAEPLVVKLITDDPNVVIYWISTSTGE